MQCVLFSHVGSSADQRPLVLFSARDVKSDSFIPSTEENRSEDDDDDSGIKHKINKK